MLHYLMPTDMASGQSLSRLRALRARHGARLVMPGTHAVGVLYYDRLWAAAMPPKHTGARDVTPTGISRLTRAEALFDGEHTR